MCNKNCEFCQPVILNSGDKIFDNADTRLRCGVCYLRSIIQANIAGLRVNGPFCLVLRNDIMRFLQFYIFRASLTFSSFPFLSFFSHAHRRMSLFSYLRISRSLTLWEARDIAEKRLTLVSSIFHRLCGMEKHEKSCARWNDRRQKHRRIIVFRETVKAFFLLSLSLQLVHAILSFFLWISWL